MPRKLQDIEIDEISLVEQGANRKKFAIIKRRRLMDEFIKLLKEFLGEEAIDAETVKKSVAALGADVIKKMSGALTHLATYFDEFPEAIQKSIMALIEVSTSGVAVEKAEDLTIEKLGARLSKATLEELRKIKDVLMAAIGQLPELKKAKTALEALIGQGGGAADEGGDVKKGGLAAEERLELERLRSDEKLRVKKAADDDAAAKKKKDEDLEKRLDALEKSRGIRKSIDTDSDDKDEVEKGDKGTVDKWPSIPVEFLFGGRAQ